MNGYRDETLSKVLQQQTLQTRIQELTAQQETHIVSAGFRHAGLVAHVLREQLQHKLRLWNVQNSSHNMVL